MKTVIVSKSKACLSDYLNQVKIGVEVLITGRGKPVPRMVPITRVTATEASLTRMEKQGLIRRVYGPPLEDYERYLSKDVLFYS